MFVGHWSLILIYPKELRPQPNNILMSNEDVCGKYLLRETHTDLYEYIRENKLTERDEFNNCTDEVLKNFIDYPCTSKEVYELSLYLFGTFNQNHLGLRLISKDDVKKYQYVRWYPGMEIPDVELECKKDDGIFPIFFETNKLSYEIDYSDKKTKESIHTKVSFEHIPNLINYWHFQLFSEANNQKLSRSLGQEKYSRLAKFIIKELFVRAVCLDGQVV